MPTKVYDGTLRVMRAAIDKAKLGREERLDAIRRLDEQARRIDHAETDPQLNDIVREDRRRSHEFGGRSVFGWEPARAIDGDAHAFVTNRHDCDLSAPRAVATPSSSPGLAAAGAPSAAGIKSRRQAPMRS